MCEQGWCLEVDGGGVSPNSRQDSRGGWSKRSCFLESADTAWEVRAAALTCFCLVP